jgi:hypothetical protein
MRETVVPTSRRWRQFFFRALIVLIALAIGLAIAAPWAIGWLIGSQLKSQLAANLNARLVFSSAIYEFPYGVRVEKAHVVIPSNTGGADSTVDVGRLELSLAKLPIGSGPVLIQKLAIDDPVVHLASSRSSTPSPVPTTAPSTPSQKLSDLFQLQNVSISNGRFEYDFSRPGQILPPMVWGHLDVNMNTAPASAGLYKFVVAIADAPVVKLNGTGSFDIDSLRLNVEKMNLALLCDPAHASNQIPPQAMAVIRQYQLAGQLTIQGSGAVPFQSPKQSTFTASLDLKNGHCQIPGWTGAIAPTDCSLTASKQSGPLQFTLSMRDQQQSSVDIAGALDFKSLLLDLDKVQMSLQGDPAKPLISLPASVADSLQNLKTGGQLTLQANARVPLQSPARFWWNARLTLKDGQCQPPGWAGPVAPAKFVITASNTPSAATDSPPQNWPSVLPDKPADVHLWLSNLSAASGNQIFKLDSGELTFNPTDNTWTARKLQGVADVGDGPGPLQADNVRVILPFIAAGDSNSGLRIALDDAFATSMSNHLHFNRIAGLITLTSTGLTTSDLVATCAQGQVKTNVRLRWTPPPEGPDTSLIYGCETQIKQLDLHQLAIDCATDPAMRQQAVGQLDFNLNCHGSILRNSSPTGKDSAADRFEAAGDFDITNGHFVDIPVLKQVVAAMHDPGGSTVGEAAARFDIAHEIIRFKRAAASSPSVGIQGNGTLGFDRQVNMKFVGTLFAGWGKKAQGGNALTEAGAAVFGKVQDLINGVQRAFYQFRVTGDISEPTVTAVPVPFLADNVTTLFEKMAGGQKQGSVAEGLQKQGDAENK